MNIVHMQFGSHVYGTNIATSDQDFKCVVIPSCRDILLQKATGIVNTQTKSDKLAKNTAQDQDLEVMPVMDYLRLLCSGQTVAYDMLFTPECWHVQAATWQWHKIQAHKHVLLSSEMAGFVGYCRQQAEKYGIKGKRIQVVKAALDLLQAAATRLGAATRIWDIWPDIEKFTAQNAHTAISREILDHASSMPSWLWQVCGKSVQHNNTIERALSIFEKTLAGYGKRSMNAYAQAGHDYKALMHAVRIGDQALEFLTTGHIVFPRPNAQELIDIRMGAWSDDAIAHRVEANMQAIDAAKLACTLPSTADRGIMQDLVLEFHAHAVMHDQF